MPADQQLLHCPQCGYDLRGQLVERCPECGLHYDIPAIRAIGDDAFVRVMMPLLDALPLALAAPFLLLSSVLTNAAWRLLRMKEPLLFILVGLLVLGPYLAALTTLRERLLRPPRYRPLPFHEALIDSLPELFHPWRIFPMVGFMLPFIAIPFALSCIVLAACWAGLAEKRRRSGTMHHALTSLTPWEQRSVRRARLWVAGLIAASFLLLPIAGLLG